MRSPGFTQTCKQTLQRGRLAWCIRPMWNLTARRDHRLHRSHHRDPPRHHRPIAPSRQILGVSVVTAVAKLARAKRRVAHFVSLTLPARWQCSRKVAKHAISKKRASRGATKEDTGRVVRDHTMRNCRSSRSAHLTSHVLADCNTVEFVLSSDRVLFIRFC